MVCLKFAEQWISFAARWGFKSEAAACRFIHHVIDLVYEPLVSHYVKPISRAEQVANGWIKPDTPYPEAIAIIDTKFQQTNRPKGIISDNLFPNFQDTFLKAFTTSPKNMVPME